jgi:hypothetical protein
MRRELIALALVGWYLMSPPFEYLSKTTARVDSGAPLRTWQQGPSFDTAKECEAYLEHWRGLFPLGGGLATDSAMMTLCVSSDDPRLKN